MFLLLSAHNIMWLAPPALWWQDNVIVVWRLLVSLPRCVHAWWVVYSWLSLDTYVKKKMCLGMGMRPWWWWAGEVGKWWRGGGCPGGEATKGPRVLCEECSFGGTQVIKERIFPLYSYLYWHTFWEENYQKTSSPLFPLPCPAICRRDNDASRTE